MHASVKPYFNMTLMYGESGLRPPGSDYSTLLNRRNAIFGIAQYSNIQFKTVKNNFQNMCSQNKILQLQVPSIN